MIKFSFKIFLLIPLFLGSPVWAGNIKLLAGGAEDVIGSPVSATRSNVSGTFDKFYRVDFPDTSDTCTVWHFKVFADYTNAAAVVPTIDFAQSVASASAFTIRMDLLCIDQGVAYDSAYPTNATTWSITPASSTTVQSQTNAVAGVLDETGCDKDDVWKLRVCRLNADANTGVFYAYDVDLNY